MIMKDFHYYQDTVNIKKELLSNTRSRTQAIFYSKKGIKRFAYFLIFETKGVDIKTLTVRTGSHRELWEQEWFCNFCKKKMFTVILCVELARFSYQSIRKYTKNNYILQKNENLRYLTQKRFTKNIYN